MTDTATPESTATPGTPAPESSKRTRAPRDVRPVLERLFQLYPKLFGARFLPLQRGIFEELMARHGDEFKKEDLKAALGVHARSTRYLEAVASGAQRYGLDGKPAEPVAPEHVFHAIMEVFRRREARASTKPDHATKVDPRVWLRDRLVQAIEASGLTRQDYLDRVHAKDEVVLAVLDEAVAVVAEQTARREALRRAFEASGKTMEEFAPMYGLDLPTVQRLLRQR